MQITVTVQELQAFESRLREWSLAAAQARYSIWEKHNNPHHFSRVTGFVEEAAALFAKWEEENPCPRLIPRV